MNTKNTKGKQSNLRRSPVAHACLTFSMLLAAGAAQAASGWGDSFDNNGNAIRVRTYYAHSPTGMRTNNPAEAALMTDVASKTGNTGAALRKFVDKLPGVGAVGAQTIGGSQKYIPAAQASVWPNGILNDEYYEIAVIEYQEKMHSDLKNATTLRGYIQIDQYATQGTTPPAGWDSKAIPLTYPGTTTPIMVAKVDAAGNVVKIGGVVQKVQAKAVDNPHYLGPAIVATKGKAVRLKFHNLLPVGRYDAATGKRNGDLNFPVDTTLPGAGIGPDGLTFYTQNRAEVHLHGGDTPWISDGTPHQWLTPGGEADASIPGSLANTMGASNTFLPDFLKGVSQQNVPDMPTPEAGAATYYFPNNQSGRLMFYHDHSFGLTRLNVYAGEAAPYILVDPEQEAILSTVPGFPGVAETIPLVVQDKTFVPEDIKLQDGLWNNTNANHFNDGVVVEKNVWGGPSDLWYPHVYEINQDPNNATDGTNAVGRWDWGPYFWPVFPALYNIPSGAVDDVTLTPEAWMDTPIVNGVAYPSLDVQAKAYRFKILNAANDRMMNLSMFVADASVSRVDITNGGSGYTAPLVAFDAPPTGAVNPKTALGTAILDANGAVVGINITDAGNGYGLAPNVTITDPTGSGFQGAAIAGTEVKMVQAVPQVAQTTPACAVDSVTGVEAVPSIDNACWPSTWPTDGRDGGVPDPASAGPAWLQIGTEGGLLPQVATIQPSPMGYEYNRRSITVLNTFTYSLFVGNAERADVLVDFSKYAGKTLIIYNDSPAPVPAFDPRNDHWTGKADESTAGSVEGVRPGFGPNTRTVMQIKVAAAPTTPFPSLDLGVLETKLEAAYAATQEAPIVGQSYYNSALGKSFNDFPDPATGRKAFATIFTGSLQEPAFHFVPGDGDGIFSSVHVDNGGSGYLFPPKVTISSPASGITADAVASLRISAVNMTETGEGYAIPPLVTFTNLAIDPVTNAPVVSNGSGAAGVASLGVKRVVVDSFGTGFNLADFTASTTATPTVAVTFASPNNPPVGKGGVQATGVAVIKDTPTTRKGVTTHTYSLDRIEVTEMGFGYNSPPTLTVSKGVKAHSVAGVAGVMLTSPNPKKPDLKGGGGYDNLPMVQVNFRTATTAAPTVAATASVSGSVFDVTLKHNGSGYTTTPTVTIDASPSGDTATASGSALGSILVKSKAVQELFDPTYGRMNATLGIELPFTSALTQTTIPLGYVDPATEEFDDGETQIWKITHNGVDSHPIHFHLVNVQVINRIGWDGTIKPPQANEYGWKETLKFHPLEDVVVALRAKKPKIGYDYANKAETSRSFGLPLSIRLRDPSQPEGTPAGFTQINPLTGLPDTIVNAKEDYGWEYVWHCHILGHEENDFMRPIKFNANEALPAPATLLTASWNGTSNAVTWKDNAVSEFKYTITRTTLTNGVAGRSTTVALLANAESYIDTAATQVADELTNYRYDVFATGVKGDSATASFSFPVTIPAPTNATVVVRNSTGITLTWRDNSKSESNYLVQVSTDNGASWSDLGTRSGNNAGTSGVNLTYNSPASFVMASGNTYLFKVTAQVLTNGVVTNASAPAITAPLVYVLPGATSFSSVVAGSTSLTASNVTFNWTIAGGATGYLIERSTINGTSWNTVTTIANPATTTYAGTNVMTAGRTYIFRISAIGSVGGVTVYSDPSASSAPIVFAAPTAPATVTVTSLIRTTATSTTDTVVLNWAAAATDAAYPVTSYLVQYRVGTGFGAAWTTLAATAPASPTSGTYTFPRGTAGTTVSFRVSATNIVGASNTTSSAANTTK